MASDDARQAQLGPAAEPAAATAPVAARMPGARARIPAATRIGHVHLRVADLDRARRFYESLLGFDLVAGYDGQVAFLSAGGYHHHIALNTWGSRGGLPPPPRATGLYHFAVNFPARGDLARALRRLLDAGWPLEGSADHTTHEAVYLRDPDGNGLELAWDRDPAVWRTPDGRIRMGTDHLDLDGLLAEAGRGAPAAARAPAGTHIGHVHLKVADVDRSLALYRGLLGFDLIARMGGAAAFLSAGGYHHHLALNTWESRGGARPPAGTTGLYHLAIAYPAPRDLAAAAGALLAAGWPVGGATDHGTHLAIYLRDPDQIGVELACDRAPALWPRRPDGGVDMARGRPLDLGAFVADPDGMGGGSG